MARLLQNNLLQIILIAFIKRETALANGGLSCFYEWLTLPLKIHLIINHINQISDLSESSDVFLKFSLGRL
jgi:hypothetical protein